MVTFVYNLHNIEVIFFTMEILRCFFVKKYMQLMKVHKWRLLPIFDRIVNRRSEGGNNR